MLYNVNLYDTYIDHPLYLSIFWYVLPEFKRAHGLVYVCAYMCVTLLLSVRGQPPTLCRAVLDEALTPVLELWLLLGGELCLAGNHTVDFKHTCSGGPVFVQEQILSRHGRAGLRALVKAFPLSLGHRASCG